MPGVFGRLPVESEPAMPRYTIKLNTYDPAIVEAFERLRKCRKQTAFTHEALKHFLASEKGAQVIELMGGESAHNADKVDNSCHAHLPEKIAMPCLSDSALDSCADVLEEILK